MLPQPCHQLRGRSSTGAHQPYPPRNWNPRVRQTAPAPSSLPVFPLLGTRHGSGTQSKIARLSKTGKVPTWVGKDDELRPKQRWQRCCYSDTSKQLLHRMDLEFLYLPCLRHSLLLGVSSLSEDRCLFLPRVWISYCLLHPLLHAKSLLSWPTCDSRLVSPQDSRQEHWSGLPCPPHIFHFSPSQIIHIYIFKWYRFESNCKVSRVCLRTLKFNK